MPAEPRWRRRATERPGEIADAALAIFAERGYAAARLTDIAAQAGVSKAALYVYYPTKEDLFRAVLLHRSAPETAAIAASVDMATPFADILEPMLARLAETLGRPELRKLARMVIAESGNFPEIARAWHETIVAPALGVIGAALALAQAKGEVRPGDPKLMALTIIGPLFMGAMWREVMEPIGGDPVDLPALAREHRATLMSGLLLPPKGLARVEAAGP